MKTLEQQYKEYKVEDKVFIKTSENPELVLLSIEELIKYMGKTRKIINRELFKNKTVTEINRIINYLLGEEKEPQLPEQQLLGKDATILVQMSSYIDDNVEYLLKVLEVITKENNDELVKLVDFLVENYISNLSLLQSKRRNIESRLSGTIPVTEKIEDTREEFKHFFYKEIKKYELKPVENKK